MLPYVHILLSDLKTWFFCQLYMFCSRGGVTSGKFLREYWIFYTARRRRKNSEVLGVKMMPHIHILGFFLRSKWCHIYTFFFCGQKCCKIYTFSSVFGQNATIYIHILGFFGIKMLQHTHICVLFWGSKWYHIYTFWFFFYQNAAIYIHFVFFWSKCCNIYIFVSVFGIKMLPYIHILGFFWVKMLPYIHISGILIFSKKTKKQKTIRKDGLRGSQSNIIYKLSQPDKKKGRKFLKIFQQIFIAQHNFFSLQYTSRSDVFFWYIIGEVWVRGGQ